MRKEEKTKMFFREAIDKQYEIVGVNKTYEDALNDGDE